MVTLMIALSSGRIMNPKPASRAQIQFAVKTRGDFKTQSTREYVSI